MVKISSENPEPSLIRYAADQIRAGEVLGMPTDTFYGLAADPFNLRAVERVYEIKSRSRHKPLSLLIEDGEQAQELARPVPEEFHALSGAVENHPGGGAFFSGDFGIFREGVMQTAITKRTAHAWLFWTAVLALVLLVAAFASVTRTIVHDSRKQKLHHADAIIVFGAAEYDGRPSPVFRARLDHAYDLFFKGLAP